MTKWIERIAIVLFCLLIAIPFGLTLLGVQSASSENRTLAQAPTLSESGAEFTADFETYFNDTFPLRTQLVRLNSWLSLNLLRTAPGSQVIAGRDGYLFFSETVPDYSGTRDVSDDYLEQLASRLADVQAALDAQGTTFVVAIAPNKNSIYPEYMPAVYPQGETSAYDRLMPLLHQHGVRTADLKAALIQAKEDGAVYHKLDTHWNDRGALAAYRTIAQTVLSARSDLQLTMYDSLIFTEQVFTGDLATTMLGLSGKEYVPRHGLHGFTADSDDHYAPKLNTQCTEGARFTVYRDSFGTALVPYIAQATGSAFFTRALPYDFAAAQGSDVAVLEIAERNIGTMLQEIVVPDFSAVAEEPPAETPETQPSEEVEIREPGWDIPTPEPFDKDELPDDLKDVRSHEDEWDDYDPFSEPPGTVEVPSTEDEPSADTADYRLLITSGTTSATVQLLDTTAAGGSLSVRSSTDDTLQTVNLSGGAFLLTDLTPGTRYPARLMLAGKRIDLFVQTQPLNSAAADLTAECTATGLQLRWTGEANAVYRIERSTFLESGWSPVAEVSQPDVLLPYPDTLQASYRVVRLRAGEEEAVSAPITLMRPVLDLPRSERDFEQEYLPLASREDQIIYIMDKDIDGNYAIPVHAMLTSTGESASRTPTGAYEFWRKREWMTWIEGQYSQYNLDFHDKLKIHSVLFAEKNHNTPIFSMREKLGRPVSGGCLRLTVTDAKWVFEHFDIGDWIEIVDGSAHPTLKQELKDTLPEL